MRLILSKCPNCKRVVAFSPAHLDMVLQCAFCGYKDMASRFVDKEVKNARSSEKTIEKAWDAIRRVGINENERDINQTIDNLSNQYALPPSIVVELLNMSLAQRNGTPLSEPTRLSDLKGDEALLQELLRAKDDYQEDISQRHIVIHASIFEQQRNENIIKELRRENLSIKKYSDELKEKIVELQNRLSKYE